MRNTVLYLYLDEFFHLNHLKVWKNKPSMILVFQIPDPRPSIPDPWSWVSRKPVFKFSSCMCLGKNSKKYYYDLLFLLNFAWYIFFVILQEHFMLNYKGTLTNGLSTELQCTCTTQQNLRDMTIQLRLACLHRSSSPLEVLYYTWIERRQSIAGDNSGIALPKLWLGNKDQVHQHHSPSHAWTKCEGRAQ